MKLCSMCIKSDMLCNACNKRVESGLISKSDVAVSRALHKLHFDCDYMKSFETDGTLVILADRKATGLLIGKAGKNVNKLSTALGKQVKVIEHMTDEKKFIEKIIGGSVLGINKVYGQNEIYKIRVENRMRKRTQNMAPIVSKVLDKNVKFVFE
ncbi:MAG: hypothetical protein NT120_02960 [Candidatus Aenigmarchaeota archaeon]|nr:hypothetical protein [Candidatus Aenigmarchaeota archaeon]